MEAGRSQSCAVGGPKRLQTVICVCVHYRSRQNEHIGQGPTIFSKGDDFVFVLWPLNRFAESTEWEDGHGGRWLERLGPVWKVYCGNEQEEKDE